MKSLMKLARTPGVVVPKGATVLAAVQAMIRNGVGAAAVVENGRAVGIFTERDAVARVLLEERSPRATIVGDVMTSRMLSVSPEAEPREARRLMIENGVRHLPVVDSSGVVLGMVSLRHLMFEEIDDLEHELEGIAGYAAADSPGG